MAATDVRPKITLACEECKHRNYITRKNRRNDPDRLEIKKFCPNCGMHRSTRKPAERTPVDIGEMALDQAFVGRSVPADSAVRGRRREDPRVRRGDRRRRTRSTADRGRPARLGHPDVVAPPTFAIAVIMTAAQVICRPRARPGLQPGRARRPAVRASPADRGRRPADRRPSTIDAVRGRGRQRPDLPPAARSPTRRRAGLHRLRRRWSRAARRELHDRSGASTTSPSAPSCPALTFPVTRGRPGQVRRRLRRLQPDPLERAGRHRGRPARRDRARHVHHGLGRPGRHRLGRRPRRWSRSTRCASPGRSSSRTTTRARRRGHRDRRREARRQPARVDGSPPVGPQAVLPAPAP